MLKQNSASIHIKGGSKTKITYLHQIKKSTMLVSLKPI